MRATRPVAALVAVALAATSLLIGATAGASGPPSNTPTFDPATPLAAGVVDTHVGDLTGDGLPDIATFNEDATVTVFTNGPAGSFTSTTTPSFTDCALWGMSAGPAGIALVCDNGPPGGDATFILLDATGQQVASAPLTVDEILDAPQTRVVPTEIAGSAGFAVGVAPGSPSVGTIVTFWMDSGTLTSSTIPVAASAYPAPQFESMAALVVAGVPSIAWGVSQFDSLLDATLAIVPADGSGAQQDVVQTELQIPGFPSVGSADFNADGLDDLLMVGTARDSVGGVTNLQQPDGSFISTYHARGLDAAVPGLVSTPSFTGSCYADIVLNAYQGRASVFITNDGGGGFQVMDDIDELSVAVIDLNGDQRADRVLRTGSAISLMMQNTLSPVFTQQPITVTAVPAGESVTYSIATDPAIQSGEVQWQSASAAAEDWTDIPGAVDPDYTFTAAPGDAGRRFRAVVTTTDGYSALSCPASLDRIDPALGGFLVTKAVDGDAESEVAGDVPFTVNYSYRTPDGQQFDGSFVVTRNTPNGLDNLLPGTEVSLSEAERPAVGGVEWAGIDWSTDHVTIVSGETTPVTLTNTADEAPVGGFVVSKSVAGSGHHLVGSDIEFTVTYEYDGPDGRVIDSFLVSENEPNGLDNLPAGTDVILTEVTFPDVPGIEFGEPVWMVDYGDESETYVGAAEVTIADDQTAQIILTNDAQPKYGSFSVIKTVTGGGDIGNTMFHVEYSWEEANGFPAGGGTMDLVPGIAEQATHIPPGVEVRLEETVPHHPGVEFDTPIWSDNVQPERGNPYAARFTSSLDRTDISIGLVNPAGIDYGSFTITKTVTGNGTIGTDPFEIAYSWTEGPNYPAGAGTLVLAPNESGQVLNVPPGASVRLVEASRNDHGVEFEQTWTNAERNPLDHSEATFTASTDGTDVTIGLLNTATAVLGDLSVTKEVTGAAAGRVGGDFLFVVEYSYTDAGGVLREGVLPVSKNNPSQLIEDLPVGTVVKLSERTPRYAGVTFGEPIWSGDVVVDQGVVTVTIIGNETVEAELENPAAPVPPLLPFTGVNVGLLIAGASLLLAAGGLALVVRALRRRLVG